jgi:thiol:disulfide interchange protein DsbD
MLFAFLGGLVLNLMPCVLPILSLKALALARHGGSDGGEARASGISYFAGVLASFALLAILLAALRGAGLAFGWGFQFQSPVFVLGMAALFFALALSLSGVFSIGGGAAGLGENLTRKPGAAGSFFTGVLATIAATPCTAPFMGVAIGFALTRPAFELALVLEAMAVGFGLPVLALSLSPAARALLPAPGPWMETLKQVLAFPLYATVAWLVWVLSLQIGSDGVLAAGITLTAVGFAAWLVGRASARPALNATLAAAVLIAATLAALPGLLSGSAPFTVSARTLAADAEPYSETRLAELRASGRPVFVNLTAAWCISCKVNERLALATEGFRNALVRHNAAYLKGDWTNQDESITRLLKTYGRAGVPLYLLYPADPSRPAIVLPQLLTEAIVVRHFDELDRRQSAAR